MDPYFQGAGVDTRCDPGPFAHRVAVRLCLDGLVAGDGDLVAYASYEPAVPTLVVADDRSSHSGPAEHAMGRDDNGVQPAVIETGVWQHEAAGVVVRRESS